MLGRIQLVRSVTAVDVKLKVDESKVGNGMGQPEAPTTKRKGEAMNKKMLHEERGVFAANEDDIGCIHDLEMSINLTATQSPGFKRR